MPSHKKLRWFEVLLSRASPPPGLECRDLADRLCGLVAPVAPHHGRPVTNKGNMVVKVAKERYVSHMAKTPFPRNLRGEVVASKDISTLGISAKGMVLYQPGGLAERQAILSEPGSPGEAQTVGAAIAALRRWIRWKRRAEELGVSVPDPTIVARGLSRLTKKPLTRPLLSMRSMSWLSSSR